MVAKKKFTDYFETAPNTLASLGIDRSMVLRAVESLKADLRDLSPQNLALELGVPRALIYEDLEILDIIYRNSGELTGHDKLINDILGELKSLGRKLTKQEKELTKLKDDFQTSFNDGFAKGASLNFSSVKSEMLLNNGLDELEIWARGILHIDPQIALTEQKIKKNYRFLLGILHPDRSGVNTTDALANLKKAYDYLLDKYE